MRLYKYYVGLPDGDWIEGYILARSSGWAICRIFKKIQPTWFAIGKPNQGELMDLCAKLALGLVILAWLISFCIGVM
jgi:hypothetical protein